MRTASLDLILNMLFQKIRSFLFCLFPITGVALFTECRSSQSLNILSETSRNFLFSSFRAAVVSLSSPKFVTLKF